MKVTLDTPTDLKQVDVITDLKAVDSVTPFAISLNFDDMNDLVIGIAIKESRKALSNVMRENQARLLEIMSGSGTTFDKINTIVNEAVVNKQHD